MNKVFALLAALLFTACLDEASDDASTDSSRRVDDRVIEIDGPTTTTREGGPEKPKSDDSYEVPTCDQIVETEGACAVACDEEALADFIPAGTCVIIPCTLDDGRTFYTGGCNP